MIDSLLTNPKEALCPFCLYALYRAGMPISRVITLKSYNAAAWTANVVYYNAFFLCILLAAIGQYGRGKEKVLRYNGTFITNIE